MKTFIASIVSLLAAATAFAQGTITFNNRVAGTLVTHVYLYQSPSGVAAGNGPDDTPPGTVDWTGCVPLAGTNWLAQLLGRFVGEDGSLDLVEATTPPTTFRTGAAAGFVNATTAAFGNVPKDAIAAYVQMAVWDNSSRLYPTWAAVKNSPTTRGLSPIFIVRQIGGDIYTPPNLTGLASFGLIPEPGTFALAALGLVSLWAFRRQYPQPKDQA